MTFPVCVVVLQVVYVSIQLHFVLLAFFNCSSIAVATLRVKGHIYLNIVNATTVLFLYWKFLTKSFTIPSLLTDNVC